MAHNNKKKKKVRKASGSTSESIGSAIRGIFGVQSKPERIKAQLKKKKKKKQANR